VIKKPGIRRIVSALAVLLLAGGVSLLSWALYGQGESGSVGQEIVPHFYQGEPGAVYALENEWLRFELDGDTTQFTVTNKEDGHVWRSVPEGADKDPIALAGSKNLLQSTLAITYSTNKGVRTLYDSYEYSIRNQVYEIESDARQVRVNYTLGRIQRAYFIPNVISQERMDGFLGSMEKAQSRKILDSYRKYDPAKLNENQKAELLLKYPVLQDGAIFVLRDTAKDFLKAEFEDLFANAGYTYDDYLMDQTGSGASVSSSSAIFSLSVIYRLEGRDLIVQVPMEELAYSSDFPPVRLNLLPNFGAGGTTDEGFILVPEGGGGIIRFNNGKRAQNSYFANMYGWDYASIRYAVVHETNARFPLFGMVNGRSAFLCMLEESASMASLAADISGRGNSYNTASASYTLLHSDPFNVTDRTVETIYMYEASLPKGNITQRYRFIPTDDAVELAKAYRGYLRDRFPGLQPLPDRDVPVCVEIIGAIDKVLQKGGLPVSSPIRLTSYREAADMAEEIAEWVKGDLYVRLSGWMNGGVKQKVLSGVRLISQLGNAADFRAMSERISASGARLYLNGITQFALDSGLMEGFVSLRDAARFTTREQVKLYPYSIIWYGQMDHQEPYYLLKPETADTMIRNLADAAKARGAGGVAFEDVGQLLSADYNPQKTVTREEAMASQSETLRRIREEGLGVMIRGGNLYALEAADIVTDTDMEGERYSILDDSVPLVQIALHGLVRYTGKPLNLSGDWEQELLMSAKCGAGLSFTFMKEDPIVLEDTEYSMYFGSTYDLWKEDARRITLAYQEKLGGIFGQAITGFERLPGDLTVTSYEDGTRVAVNFSQVERDLDGMIIPARSYEVIPGEVKK